MDLLVFDAKKRGRNRKEEPVAFGREDVQEMTGGTKIDAFLTGGIIQIFDERSAEILHEMVGIGEWLDDEREESTSVSRKCFRDENELNGLKWAESSPVVRILVLSPIETVFLALDWQVLLVKRGKNEMTADEIWLKMKALTENPENFGKSLAVFRFLKQNGWIVRSGHTFGCDFLIYCLGPQLYHSSAGVLVTDRIDPQRLLTVTRILSHNKKALMVATCSDANVETFEDAVKAEVKIATMKTYFLERDVAHMSNRRNEVYEVKETAID